MDNADMIEVQSDQTYQAEAAEGISRVAKPRQPTKIKPTIASYNKEYYSAMALRKLNKEKRASQLRDQNENKWSKLR